MFIYNSNCFTTSAFVVPCCFSAFILFNNVIILGLRSSSILIVLGPMLLSKGINLSISKNTEYNLDYYPSYFISDITNAFFNSELICKKDKNGKTGKLGVFNNVEFYFFYENDADLGVYFLTTAYHT